MRTKITTVLITACFIFTSYCFAYERVNARGPMAIRNQSPLYLFYYFFPQDRADVVKQGKLDTAFDYTVSNVVVDKVTTPTEEYIVRMDMEVERYNLGLKYGVLDRLEVGLEVPYISLSGGYLDSFVEEFEDLIGATPVGARSRASKDQFNYNIQHNNRNLINTREEASGLGDIALCAKYMLVDEGDMGHMPRTSIRGAVKFPTADEDKYLGNGGVDYGLGVLFDKSFEKLFAYMNLSVVFIEEPKALESLDINNHIWSSMFALEYCFTERFSSVVQATWNSTPYPDTGTDPMDNYALEIGLGLNYQATMNSNWHIAVVENTTADSSPDVTFQAGGRIRF